jgi:MoxR-like ATPase
MNAPHLPGGWSEANQRLLVAEFARIRNLLGETGTVGEDGPEACRALMPSPAAIDVLASLFGLSAFERDVLLLAAGIEMDAAIAVLCSAAVGHPARPWATFALALAVLPEPHWSALSPYGQLRRCRLVDVDETEGLTGSRIRIEERVLHFIAGLNDLDQRLAPLLERVGPAGAMCEAHCAVVDRAVERILEDRDNLRPLVLSGDDEHGQQDVAADIAARLGLDLYRLHATDIPSVSSEQAALAMLWSRDGALLASGLLITRVGVDVGETVARFARRVDGLVVVTGRDAPSCGGIRFTIDLPDMPERRRLWQSALGPCAIGEGAAVDALATHLRLGARRIGELAETARRTGGLDAVAVERETAAERAPMPGLAQRVESRATWSDIVLPPAQTRMLAEIASHARHRMKVYHDWGYARKSARGLGIASLFWGDSGTGKTLAAEVLAGALGLPLHRIDLSAVVSKYIGETEKNLATLFDAAAESGAILLFDEADALFGKRSDVKDSHDRYANIEVSFLLQRMEAHPGLAILTTNNKAALDVAFQRRLRFVVHFPFPDEAQREGIWRAVFPADAPLYDIDYRKLARLSVAGGTIRNIALSAAFLAAEAGTPIGMAELLCATRFEAGKRDVSFSDVETRGWV